MSDDRVKDNSDFIETACENLSKLRPQLYDKQTSVDTECAALGAHIT